MEKCELPFITLFYAEKLLALYLYEKKRQNRFLVLSARRALPEAY